MQLSVKTLKGTSFKITVQPSDTIIAVKKNIEEVQGKDNYPWGQQMLIHQGKILKDESTLEEIKISENDFLVVMLTKNKTSSTAGASSVTQSSTAPATSSTSHHATSEARLAPASANVTPSSGILLPEVFDGPATYDQAASNLVAGNNRELIIQELMDLGNGNWNKDTVLRALRAAYNNPTRAVEYLYSGIPASTEVSIPAAPFPSNPASRQAENTAEEIGAGPSPHFGLPNSAPLNMFPQGTPSAGAGAGAGAGSLDFLRHNQQFQALRAMVQANPQILQPMLQELSKQNPQLLRLIQEHHSEFLRLINEPVEGLDGDLFDQHEQEMPHAISVTPAEQEAIERLEAMGFDRGRVIEAFLACDRNEELAANYLLEHSGDED